MNLCSPAAETATFMALGWSGRHPWQRGDVALWDNFGTVHYGVTADLGNSVRRLYRVAAWSKQVRPTLNRETAVRELLAKQFRSR